MNTLLFVLTLPFKPVLAWCLNRYLWLYNRFHYVRIPTGTVPPDEGTMLRDRVKILLELERYVLKLPPTGFVLNTNPDHQALRQGSLVWALRATPYFMPAVGGMLNFISGDLKFKRGLDRPADAPPEMSISQAFAVACALEHAGTVPPDYASRFVLAVEAFMEIDFTASDSSSRMTVKSTAFDIVAVCSMLYSAAALCPGTGTARKFLRRARLLIVTHGLMALEPLTYRPGDRRYFIEHQVMFGAWAAYKTAPTWLERLLFRWIMWRTYALSAVFTNPYFAALADECGALSETDRRAVILAHGAANIYESCIETEVAESAFVPMNWAERRSSEFNFDGTPNGRCRVATNPVVHSFVPLSGLVLSMSLISLRRENGWGIE